MDSSSLTTFSEAIADLVEGAASFTATVHGRRRLPATGIVWAEDLIVSANHVVERDDDIEVAVSAGERRAATVAGRDPATDLVLLRVEGGGLTPAPRAGRSARPGNLGVAIGRARAGAPHVSIGVINAVDYAVRVGPSRIIEPVLQSEIVMLPGFSGGPLLNAAGEILGINSSHIGRGNSLTLSVEAIAPILDALATHGKLRRGYLGIGAQAVGISASQVKDASLAQEVGLVILSIDDGGPAQQAGLLIGDIVIAVGGAPVASVDDLVEHLPGELIGSRTPVTIVRGSERQDVAVTVGERA
jgi:S1-C subfamily serine protease